MNHAIILAGGIGSRMHINIPKQYLLVNNVPVFMYSFRKFNEHPLIDSIVLVVADEWKDFVINSIHKENIKKRVELSSAGTSRQHSIMNGLLTLSGYADDSDCVFVHDAVRPMFPLSIIDDGIEACRFYDEALPVVAVKDATYQSSDGKCADILLPKEQLRAGQSPCCFVYGKYYAVHKDYLNSPEKLDEFTGAHDLALQSGMSIKYISGDDINFKITTINDLNYFQFLVKND